MTPIFLEAAHRIDTGFISSRRSSIDLETLIYHHRFHPGGLYNKEIHSAFQNTCLFGNTENGLYYVSNSKTCQTTRLGYTKLLVARSRPRNLHDYLSPSTIHQPKGSEVSTYLSWMYLRVVPLSFMDWSFSSDNDRNDSSIIVTAWDLDWTYYLWGL